MSWYRIFPCSADFLFLNEERDRDTRPRPGTEDLTSLRA